MPSSWWWKLTSILFLILASVIVMVPTFLAPPKFDVPPEWEEFQESDALGSQVRYLPAWYTWYTDNLYGSRLTLGLDLQGGLHLQYQVDVDKAIEQKLDTFADDLEVFLQSEAEQDDGSTLYSVEVEQLEDQTTIIVRLDLNTDGLSSEEATAAETEMVEIFDEAASRYPLTRTDEGDHTYRLDMSSEYIEDTRVWAIDTAISIITERVNGLGVAEPSIQRRGDRDIIIQLPGLDETQFDRARETIGTTAQLDFRGVHSDNRSYWGRVAGRVPEIGTVEYVAPYIEARDATELRDFAYTLANLPASDPAAVPEDALIVFEEDLSYDPRTGALLVDQTVHRMMLVNAEREMTGETISDVRSAQDPQTNRPFVSVTFDSEGKDLFCQVTTRYDGELLAIVLDDVVKSAPVIQEPICGGRARINMGSTGSYEAMYIEVQNLVIVLRHGALPAPIEPQFETQVGPSLGEESIRKGTLAMVVGSILVIIFMMIYYKVGGLIANVALLLNILFVLAMLTGVHATLTLPGIAGIILTVGMAVDANVIIFERIREELRLGKTARDALSSGYQKALWTVLDANITTAIAAMVLANYGSGPIRGFAVTLIFGIMSSVFTALFVTRMLFELYLAKSKSQTLSI